MKAKHVIPTLVLGTLLGILLGSVPGMCADDAETQDPEVLLPPDPFSITMSKMTPDDRGTDVTDIYTFEVAAATEDVPITGYMIVYHLDGRPVKDFPDSRLPFSFSRNLKGVTPGAHEIVVELEDDEDHVLHWQAFRVEIVGKK